MSAPPSFSRRRALSTAAALFIAGCSQPAPLKSTFVLQPARPAPSGAPARPVTLRVDAVTVAAPFRSRSLVYRASELKYETDFYNEFLIPPGPMLGEAIAGWLAATGLYQAVLPPFSTLDADLSLDAFVTELYGDLRDAGKPAAVVSIKFFLRSARAPGGFLWTGELTARRELAAPTAEAIVGGLDAALGEVLGELAAALSALPVK